MNYNKEFDESIDEQETQNSARDDQFKMSHLNLPGIELANEEVEENQFEDVNLS